MKMNTNGANNFDGVGPNCYHFTSLLTPVASMISNDFIGHHDQRHGPRHDVTHLRHLRSADRKFSERLQ
jgi:hypothetical protein